MASSSRSPTPSSKPPTATSASRRTCASPPRRRQANAYGSTSSMGPTRAQAAEATANAWSWSPAAFGGLFGPQRGDWIDARRPSSRQIRREQRRGGHDHARSHERKDIVRPNAEQISANRDAGGKGKRHTRGKPDPDRGHRVDQHRAHDAPSLGAERDADADLLHPLRDAVADDAVHAERGEKKGGGCEHPDHAGQQLPRPQRATDVVVQQDWSAERLVPIDIPDRLADRWDKGQRIGAA